MELCELEGTSDKMTAPALYPKGKTKRKGNAMPRTAGPAQHAGMTAATGHHAPVSGWWRRKEDPKPVRYVQRGEIMPALEGTQTIWTLVQELEPNHRVHSDAKRRLPQASPGFSS